MYLRSHAISWESGLLGKEHHNKTESGRGVKRKWEKNLEKLAGASRKVEED